MKYFDMHCDTLSRCYDNKKSIYENDLMIDLKRLNQFEKSVQFFAAYINTFNFTGEKAYERFCQQYEVFKTINDYNCENVTAVLTIESLSCLNNDIDRITLFKDCGVKVASLNWNGYNGIAGGIGSDEGISDFGRAVIKKMEELDIVIDVSHLNDKSFYQLCDIATKPFIATHSNTRSYCSEPRNLTDEQLKILFESGGIVGLNFYTQFLGERKPLYDDLMYHIDNMYKCGGEGKVSLGSDFDGCDTDDRFSDVSKLPAFYDYLSQKISEKDANGIFYNNAMNFFEEKF